ncbi:unnamed protein product [Bursaphelenchus xylophilus]|uniref:glutathione transferase n=1 Tax=Bursaphelenchus xylophilus TaxID=6326 RepID=A0A1I7RZW7_BURXY|nr:unnamed protein product [Bursaphelenchus xylophilus]CAG9109178.1 unnamed protein product [Bursaphelenchus xylophilus]
MVQYKLTYFDIRGLGEPARIIFHYAGQKFEDDRITGSLDSFRDQLPFGQIPVLTIDGTTKIAQSQAIYRLLARRFGLAGKDDVEQAQIDSYGDFIQDLNQNARQYFLVKNGRAEGDVEKLEKDLQTYIDTKWVKYFDRIFEASGSGFIHKSGVTWIDFVITNIYETAVNLDLKPTAGIKHFKTIHDNVKALPQLKEYFSQRKQTPF